MIAIIRANKCRTTAINRRNEHDKKKTPVAERICDTPINHRQHIKFNFQHHLVENCEPSISQTALHILTLHTRTI